MTVDELITRMGGPTRLATLLGLPLGTISSWRTRRRIPVDYWRAIVEAALFDAPHVPDLAGVTYEALVAMHTAPPDIVHAAE